MKKYHLVFRKQLPVAVEEAFAWHEQPGTIHRLIPPWENVKVAETAASLHPGERAIFEARIGPFPLHWVAEHTEYQPPESFCDEQISGPFAYWQHKHRFFPESTSQCVLEDRVQYALPFGWIGAVLGKRFVERKIHRMFAYRQETTAADLAAQRKYKEGKKMKVAVTGCSGLVGSTLKPYLENADHTVTPIVRSQPRENEVYWNPLEGEVDTERLAGTDAVVHLAGENIGEGRWTAKKKQRIVDSRVKGTRLLCESLAVMAEKPRTLIVASAIGFYGDRGDELLDEESAAGDSFLSEVCKQWEEATQPAQEAGIRVVKLRLGVVLSSRGGAIAKMLTPFKLGVGGRIGSGNQYWSWVAIDDVIGAIEHALMTESLAGPVNVVAPHPVTNRQFTKTLGRVLGRPTIFPMPAFAARLALGEMADELLLASANVAAKRLQESHYDFRFPNLEDALRHQLGR